MAKCSILLSFFLFSAFLWELVFCTPAVSLPRTMFKIKPGQSILLPNHEPIHCLKKGKRVIAGRLREKNLFERLYAKSLSRIKSDIKTAPPLRQALLKKRFLNLERKYNFYLSLCQAELSRNGQRGSSSSSSSSFSEYPPPVCFDEDQDGYLTGQGCSLPADCNDSDPQVYPGAIEICHDAIDNNCNAIPDENCSCSHYAAQEECNADRRKIGSCLWFDGQCNTLPQDCPVVYVGENKTLMVDGEPYFPIGFWGLYYDVNPLAYRGNFSAAVDVSDQLFQFVEDPLSEGKIKMLAQAGVTVREGVLAPGSVLRYRGGRNVIAWEVYHEPNQYAHYNSGVWTYDNVRGQIRESSYVIRAADPCHRPVFITPSISGAASPPSWPYLQDHIQYVDFAMVQAAYRLPLLDLKGVGAKMSIAAANAGNKPAMLVMNINGYQPQRLRYFRREPSPAEIRAQAWDAIVHGARGVMMYSFKKGIANKTRKAGVNELSDAEYNVTDSPEQYEAIQAISSDIERYRHVLTAPASTPPPAIDASDIICQTRQVQEEDGPAVYAFCVNVADDPSPYFTGVSGGEVIFYKAQLGNAQGELAPGRECSDDLDNDRDGYVDNSETYPGCDSDGCYADPGCSSPDDDDESEPGGAYQVFDRVLPARQIGLTPISTGITWQNKTMNKVLLQVKSAPANTQFHFALYADMDRDSAPDTKLLETSWLPLNFTGEGEYSFNLPSPVMLEHTRYYYLLIEPSQPVVLRARDMRYGVRTAGVLPLPLPDTFPELHKGKAIAAKILLGRNFASCQVAKDVSGIFNPCPEFDGERLNENFEPYAVHIYKLK